MPITHAERRATVQQELKLSDLPARVRNMNTPPQQLYIHASGSETFENIMQRPRIAIVGSRNITSYGRSITTKFASELASQGVVIVSGLAFGVDAYAHRAALEVNGTALAVLPSAVTDIQPRGHASLANRIIEQGGALVSEYPDGTITYKQNFVARNRIVTALADALLITEAALQSGTLHTAKFAMDQGIDVLVVPGNITSPTSVGTNNLLKSSSAFPVTCTEDILYHLDLAPTSEFTLAKTRVRGSNRDEQTLIDLLEKGIFDGSQLLGDSGFSVEKFNHTLTMLEITAKIRALGANRWSLC